MRRRQKMMQKRYRDHFFLSHLFPEKIPQNTFNIPNDLSGCLLIQSGCDRRPDLFQNSRCGQFSLFPCSREVSGRADRVNLIADPQVVLVAQIGRDYDILYFALRDPDCGDDQIRLKT
jgi:hypothetical protein